MGKEIATTGQKRLDSNVKTILILGVARSGTSMTAGLCYHLGVNIVHIKQDVGRQNPKGAFEDPGFNDITMKMNVDRNRGMSKEQIIKKYATPLKSLIKKHQKGLWGWKSAVTHRNLDIIINFVVNPYLIIVTRNPYHNALSWIIQAKDVYNRTASLNEALQVVGSSVYDLINQVNKLKTNKLWVTYEDIKSNPINEAKRISNFLGIKLTDEKLNNIKSFIMPHHTTINEIKKKL